MSQLPTASQRILAAVALLVPLPGERLLEIGCGTGQAIEAVLLVQPAAHVTAIDRSQTAVDRARTVNAGAIADGRVTIVLGDIDKGPVAPRGFDRIFAIWVNTFWTRPGLALPHVLSSLRPGDEAWITFDESLPKTDGPILESMRALGMTDVRICPVPERGRSWAASPAPGPNCPSFPITLSDLRVKILGITSLVAAVAAIALIPLSVSVSFQRMKTGVRVGSGDDATLMRRIRAQGNFAEYVPLALIVLGLAEYRGVSSTLLWTVAELLLAGRCLHFVGIMTGRSAIRAPGMLGTYGALLLGACALLFA